MGLNTLTVLTVLLLAFLEIEARSTYGRQIRLTCNKSSECPQGQCCRNSDGAIIGMQDGNWLGNGTCQSAVTSVLDDDFCGPCGCAEGYECYRPLTGVCCARWGCWLREEAEKDRERWRKCAASPDCRLPESVNHPENELFP